MFTCVPETKPNAQSLRPLYVKIKSRGGSDFPCSNSRSHGDGNRTGIGVASVNNTRQSESFWEPRSRQSQRRTGVNPRAHIRSPLDWRRQDEILRKMSPMIHLRADMAV